MAKCIEIHREEKYMKNFFKYFFSTKNKDGHKILKILGIKIKVKDVKSLEKKFLDSRWRIKELTRNYQFFWANIDKYSTEQRIWYLSEVFYRLVGYIRNFKKPRSLNEKLNWMKFNYFDPITQKIVDKYEFKSYIKEKLGEGFTIPLLGAYEDVNDINFDSLPNQFVIKTTIGNGGIGCDLIKDKSKLNIDKLKYRYNNLMQEWHSPYYQSFQPAFKNIRPRVIIEEYMPIREGKALEYKMFCFHGEVKFCLIECDYFGKSPKRAIYDKDFNELPFTIRKLPKKTLEQKPETFDTMVKLAEKLSVNFPFVRVDFYDIKGKIYLSELTFNSGAGFSVFTPVEWDYKLGEFLDLNKLNKEYVHILPEFQQTTKSGELITC